MYETDPVGGPDDQGPYLNLVAELDTAADPARAARGLPRASRRDAGRVREVRWGPRTLDVDVLLVEGVDVDEPDLQVPHPRMWERRSCWPPWPTWPRTSSRRPGSPPPTGEVRRSGTLAELARRRTGTSA